MADARLSILLSARDDASGVLRHIGSELGLLDQKAAGGGMSFAKVGEGLAGIAKTAASFALGGLALNLGGDLAEQFKEVLGSTVDLGRGVRSLQMDVGGSAESISGLLAVFHRFGIEGDSAERTLSLFSRGMRGDLSASEASTQNAKSFSGTLAELGVEASDATGHLRPMDDVLLEVAEGFKTHSTDGQNAARAMALFGRSGRELLPALVLGRDGIVELEAEAKKLGLTLTQGNVEGVHSFVMAQKTMGEAVDGLKIQLGKELMPLFTEAAVAAAEWARTMNGEVGKDLKGFMSTVGKTIELVQLLDKVRRDPIGAVMDKANEPDNPGRQLVFNLANRFTNSRIGLAEGQSTDTSLQAEQAANRAAMAAGDTARAAQEKAAADAAQLTVAKQKELLNHQVAAAERATAVIQHDISLKTRENLDLKRSEAEIQLQMLPLKEQQADLEQKLLVAADKRVSLERDAAVMRAQMASNASADALEGLDFEERRLKLKIKADALAGRGVAPADIAALMKASLGRPEAELAALMGGRGATLAERDRARAQQAQDLANVPLRQQQADNELKVAELTRASAAVQRQIEEARLHGVVDTTDLEKQKRAIDDRIFDTQQKLADINGPITLNITQQITSNGEIDYDRVVSVTAEAVFSTLRQAQVTTGAPAPSALPGARRPGSGGPF